MADFPGSAVVLATGGGLDIALACDIRFAAESARFAETYAKMGLIPGAGGAWLLPRLVGVAKALDELQSNAAFFKVLGSYPVSLT